MGKRTSNFISPTVWLYNDNNSYNITDVTMKFVSFLDFSTPFQGLELNLSMSSDKINEMQLGHFKEKYVVTLELFDSSQKSVIDTITYDMMPYKYDGYDISILSKHQNNNDNHGTIDLTVYLINSNTVELFNTTSAIHVDKKYKDIFSKTITDLGVPIKEKDEPHSKIKHEEFFCPTARKFDHMNYVLNKGFLNKDIGEIGTSIMTNDGLCVYRTEKSKDRKKLKTMIHPKTADAMKDFQDMFVTNFKLERNIQDKLNIGHKASFFTSHVKKSRYKAVDKKKADYGQKLMLPKVFKESRSRTYEINDEYKQADFATSIDDAYRDLHHIKLTLNRWKKFEQLIPLRHILNVKFTSDLIKNNSGDYIIRSNRIVVERTGQEFTAKCELDLVLNLIK